MLDASRSQLCPLCGSSHNLESVNGPSELENSIGRVLSKNCRFCDLMLKFEMRMLKF